VKLAIVSATTDPNRSAACLDSWKERAQEPRPLFLILNGCLDQPYLGTVPAFRRGVDEALAAGAEIICAFHDDLRITEQGWDDKVIEHFRRHPRCGLAGFGGAIGLGAEDLYRRPYEPHQLARVGFRSNMKGAETHGLRSTLPERVACLDSFSMIFNKELAAIAWRWMDEKKMIHHFHDGAAACLAARHGWEVWYLPVECEHLGGRTAVGDAGYQAWALQQHPLGDQGFWLQAHETCHREFKDVLPIRV
jgi:Glycosyltransferase like family